jgi:hypothetical protein
VRDRHRTPVGCLCNFAAQGDDNLYCYADFQARLLIVRMLVQQWPQSVREATSEGLLPLHCGAASTAGKSEPRYTHWLMIIRFLVEQWPEAVRTTMQGLSDGLRSK